MRGPDIKRIACDFVVGRGRAWAWVGPEVRSALLDAAIMDQVRAAHSADAGLPITPAQLIGWRNELEYVLEAGVGRGGVHRFRVRP
jgi:hypothetical protein